MPMTVYTWTLCGERHLEDGVWHSIEESRVIGVKKGNPHVDACWTLYVNVSFDTRIKKKKRLVRSYCVIFQNDTRSCYYGFQKFNGSV